MFYAVGSLNSNVTMMDFMYLALHVIVIMISGLCCVLFVLRATSVGCY